MWNDEQRLLYQKCIDNGYTLQYSVRQLQTHRPYRCTCKVILRILRKSPNVLSRACNIAIVFLWSLTPITPRCLVCLEVVICNPGQSVVHIYGVLYSHKAHENSCWNICNSQKNVILVFRSSLLIHIRFSDDIYSRTFYRYSLFIMH